MALTKMEHYLVLTKDLNTTRDFYQDVLGLTEGLRPNLGFPGYWLYLGETPVIHIAEWETYTVHSESQGIPVTKPGKSTGAFDHIAFNGQDANEMIERLKSKMIRFEQNDAPHAKLTQLFLSDPNGIKIEINYPWQKPK